MLIYKRLNEFFKIVKSIENPDPKLRNIKGFFDELIKPIQINSRILGHFLTRTTALTSFGWDIIGDFPKIPDVKNRCKKIIDYLINNHAKTPFYGASLYKLQIKNTIKGTIININKSIPNQNFDFDFDNIYFYENGRYSETIPRDDSFYLLDIYNDEIKGGIIRSIMPIEIIRFDMILENANYLRKLKGILQIVNKGASNESQLAAEEAATNAIQNNFFISDDLIELRLNEIAGQGGQNFKSFIDMINSDIAIAILGQANTAELPNQGGSRAALQVLHLISKDIFYSDMIRVENLVNNYLFWDYLYNYDKKAIDLPYKFTFNIEEEQDIEKNAATLEAVNRVLPIKKNEAYKLVNFTPPGPDDEIIPVKQNVF